MPREEYFSRIGKEQSTYIFGQTCDGVDWLTKNRQFPYMQEGEWIIYRNFGAYGHVVATNFNGYEVPKIKYIR